MQKKLHPSVIKFKEFVRNNPKLIYEVRRGNTTWQELYEDWYLLGEDDKRWDTIGTHNDTKAESARGTDTKGDWLASIMERVQNMDPNQIQHYISNLSQALGAIQGVISQFQGASHVNQVKNKNEHKHPFLFRKD